MAERLPNSHIVLLEPQRVADRLELLKEAKPKVWKVYEARKLIADPAVVADFTKPVFREWLAQFARDLDVDPLYFTCEDDFILEHPWILRPEED